MADYYACTEVEPLLNEIRQWFTEAQQRQEPLSLTISNTGNTYPYVLRPEATSQPQQVQEVAGKALQMLRNGMDATVPLN
jgi:hypothetical protein